MTRNPVRRLLAVAALVWWVGVVSLLTAGSAAADTPQGWPAEEPVDLVHALLIIVGVPLLVFVVIAALVYGPSLARGESVAPGRHSADPEWLGGPRKAPDELEAPASEGSPTGGAGGSW